MAKAAFTFHSWQKEGIGNALQAPTLGRPKIELDIQVNEKSTKKQFQIIGAGDIIGFNKDMVIRTEPVDWNTNFPPNLLAHVEFYDEDFPWRYSPELEKERTLANGQQTTKQLRPWISLIVL